MENFRRPVIRNGRKTLRYKKERTELGKVLLSTGAYAKTPYYLEGLGIRVYSAEELCYVLKEDAFFLDRSIVDRKLIRWIEEENTPFT